MSGVFFQSADGANEKIICPINVYFLFTPFIARYTDTASIAPSLNEAIAVELAPIKNPILSRPFF